MPEDKVKSIKGLEKKLASLQKNIKTLQAEGESLVAAQKGNKRFNKLKNLEADLQAQDYIISVFKKSIDDPETYKKLLARVAHPGSQSDSYKCKEELRLELGEMSQQIKELRNELNKAKGLDKSRHEIAVDNRSLNFKKAKQPPSVISIQVDEADYDVKSHQMSGEGEGRDVVAKIMKNVKTYKNLLNREYESTNIQYDQSKDKILQARSVLINMQSIKAKIQEAKDSLLEMDSKNSKFEGVVNSYTEDTQVNLDTLKNQIKELERLREEVHQQNEELEQDLMHKEMEVDEEAQEEAKQQLATESQELRIKIITLKEKLKALDEFIIETDKDIERKNKKLEQVLGSQEELKGLFDKKRAENEQKQLVEMEHLKTQKMKRENLRVKLRMIKNEEFKNMTALEANKSLYEAKNKEFTALKLLASSKHRNPQNYDVNADEEVNKLVWQKSKLEEQILKKELYLKHHNELLAISGFNSLNDSY